jgi:curved DNA-binding protein CbpA
VHAGADPYAVLGVPRGADDAQIHAAYRDAVRRTHPDAGGSAADFEAVQEAYEVLRDPARRRAWGATPPQPPPPRPGARPASADMRSASARMEDLLAESRRLEDEARRLAGMAPREAGSASGADGSADSVAAILRDAGEQLREVAGEGARELRKRLRRVL